MSKEQELHDAICKKAVDEEKLVEAGWLSLRYTTIAKDAPQIQLDEMRLAFFAGAQHLFASIMTILEPGSDATENDYRRLTIISEELNKFYLQMKGKANA